MKNKLSQTITAILISIGIGTIFTTITYALADGPNFATRLYTVWSIASVLYGLSGVYLYSHATFPLLLSSFIHCAFCLAVTLVAVQFSNFDTIPYDGVCIEFFIIFLSINAIVWLKRKNNCNQINAKLNSRENNKEK